MGYERRLTMRVRRALSLLLMIAASGATLGCSRRQAEKEEQRRVLLKPPERPNPEQVARKAQVLDANGDVMPSDQMVAGVVLPRGLVLRSSSPPEWTYRGNQVPAAALERYFAARLVSNNIARSLGGSVTFEVARPKDDPKAPPITLRIVQLLGEKDATEIYIRQAIPGRPRPSQAEVEAQIEARRAHAE